MSRTAILTDSTANFPADWRKRYGIHIIPLKLHWEEQTLLDGVDIAPGEFYQRLETTNAIPTTSQPSPQDFLNKFETLAEDHDSILVLPISEGISGTYSSAITAAESFKKTPVEVIETSTTSGGLVWMALAAARALEDGGTLADARQAALSVRQKLQILFVVDTLTYLHRGGRIGGAARFFGTALSIKPILTINGDGKINSREQVRTHHKAIERLISLVEENNNGNPAHLGILHTNAAAVAQKLRTRLHGIVDCIEDYLGELSPVIGAHTGPGLVGVAWYCE